MMVHGWDRWVRHMDLLGIARVGLEFTGKAAHASADPWEGVNALDAAVQTYTNVAMLRQQVGPDARIHGIITHGGAAPNIIPEFAAAVFYVRSIDLDDMWALQKRVIDRKSTRLNSSHVRISYAVFCLKKKKHTSELQSRPHLVC